MKTDILIIGGGPAGIVAAISSRAYYPEKKVMVVKNDGATLVPCGLPYIFGNKIEFDDDVVNWDIMAQKQNIELVINEVVDVNYDDKKVILKNGEDIEYDKLIFATGSTPKKVSKYNHLKNVFYISKDSKEIKKAYEELKQNKDIKNIVVVGTGFIGVETGLELYKYEKNISFVGSKLLGHAFDNEFSEMIEDIVLKDGIKHYKAHLSDIEEENNLAKVVVTNKGEKIETDAIIIAIGYTPNTELAKKSGLSLRGDFIYVDEYMRTTKNDVFAVGDCAEKRDFITKRTTPIMLASTATAEARTAVSALYGIKYAKTFSGTIAAFSTIVDNRVFSSVGVTEAEALKEGLEIETAMVTVDDKHPAKLPNDSKQTIKLICMRRSGVVVGAQIVGNVDVGEMINILALAIENQVNIYSLINIQVATHPLLTSAPTAYPIAKVAQMLDLKINKER
jgi:pyruvate/2-oxoglutarate dehydrogenase complex dihydrolipoamide dehydrogenase (E3) component